MVTTKVNSSAVRTVSHNRRKKVLTIKYPNGTKYRYAGVMNPVADMLMRAPSKGRFINTVIKPKFKATKVG